MTVLRLDGVWKAFPDWTDRPPTLRGALAGRSTLFRARRRRRRWALQEVSFELGERASLGLVGHNGAGKSTLLRLVAGLGRPTRGSLWAHHATSALLNLGSTFDLQLTGRENAYTAALVAGFTRAQARAGLPGMIEFSELGEFADSPVRTYSEGMKLRLGFSIVAAVSPRLMVLDEVLAVGDAGFRAKCADRIAELREDGMSLVLASHAPAEIVQTCDRALWLQHGRVRALGDAASVVDAYQRSFHEDTLARTPIGAASDAAGLRLGENRFGSQVATVREVHVESAATGAPRVRSGEGLRVRLVLAPSEPVADPIVTLAIRRTSDDAVVIDLSSDAGGLRLGTLDGPTAVELAIERLDLPGGDYRLDVGLHRGDWDHAYDFHHAAYALRIDGPPAGAGMLSVPHAWRRTQ